MITTDLHHSNVKNALIKEGWTITHDPLTFKWGPKDLSVDLGTGQLLAAEKADHKIAVEIKSFVSPSEIEDLKNAVGQFILYNDILAQTEPGRVFYLAIREAVYVALFEEPIGEVLLKNKRVRLIVFDPQAETIVKWIP